MNIITSALGRYEVIGRPDDADVIIGHSFGTLTGADSANRALADFILEHADGRPIAADRMLVDSFPNGILDVDHIIEGPISNTTGQGVGSWGTLIGANVFMKNRELHRPMMVAQAHHIGRVAMQAKRLGIDAIVPPDLPKRFDPKSDQIWTRSLWTWLPREILGSFVLRAQKKL